MLFGIFGFQIILFLDKNDAQTISFEDAGPSIAREALRIKKQNTALESLILEVRTKWESNSFSEEESSRYLIQSASKISLNDPKVPGLGNAPELFQALQTVSSTGILTQSFPTLGGQIIAKVTAIQQPSSEELVQRSKMETMRLKMLRQRDTWEAFEVASRAEAQVNEIWKQWQQ